MNVIGTIEKIASTQAVSDKFKKREIVVKHSDNPEYPEYSTFEFIQDKCEVLDKFKVGQNVDLAFNLKGRSYADKKTGEVKYFNTLQGWMIKEAGVDNVQAGSGLAEDPDDLPF